MSNSESRAVSTAETPAGPSARLFDLLALALVPVTMLIQGHRFGIGYQDFILCFVRHANDPGWLVNDWRMNASPFHPQLLPILAGLVRSTSEPVAFLLMQIATRLLLLTGLWRLVRALVPGSWPAVATVMMAGIVLEPRFLLGFQYLQAGHWEPGFLGMAFAVWVMMSAIEYAQGTRHWTSLALFAGFGIIAHLFIVGPVFAVAMVALILQRRPAKELAWIGVAALALGFPAWGSAAKEFFTGARPLTSTQVIQLLQFRHPHHHQPWTWPPDHYVQGALLLGAGAFAWKRLTASWGGRERLVLPAVLLGYFLLSCTAFVIAGRLQTVALLAFLQPFRLLPLLLLMVQIAVVAVAASLARERAWVFFPVAFGGLLAMALVRWHGPVLVAALLAWYAAQPLLPPAASLLRARSLRIGAALLLVPAWVALVAMQTSPRLQEVAGRVRRDHWLARIEPRPAARAELTRWVRSNTLPYDLFAIPPAMESFRLWEQRPIVVDFGNVPFTNSELNEWAQRVSLGWNTDPFVPFARVPDRDANAWQMVLLAKTYGARFVVLREPLEDPSVVFSNAEYTVLDLSHGSILE